MTASGLWCPLARAGSFAESLFSLGCEAQAQGNSAAADELVGSRHCLKRRRAAWLQCKVGTGVGAIFNMWAPEPQEVT